MPMQWQGPVGDTLVVVRARQAAVAGPTVGTLVASGTWLSVLTTVVAESHHRCMAVEASNEGEAGCMQMLNW